jgi:hypothetical protein
MCYFCKNQNQQVMNLKECIRPVSYLQNNDMKDAINILKLIQLSERDVAAGNYSPAEKVFADIKSKYANVFKHGNHRNHGISKITNYKK